MPRPIKAAVFTQESGRHCEILDLYLDDPGPEEIVIEVKACGICHTDIGVAEYQSRPAVLGHETAGIIVQLGSKVSEFKLGDRVVATFSSCGYCATCENDKPAYCMDHAARNFEGRRPNGKGGLQTIDGDKVFSAFFQQSGFASHALVQRDNLVKIPDGLPFEHAAPLGCGIQTGAGSVINSLGVKAGEAIVIFGVGAVGLSAVMAAHHIGCAPIIAVDLEEDRLDMAKSYGAHHVLKGDQENLTQEIRDLTGGGAHYSLEGTGVNAVFHIAVNCLRPGGTCGTLAYPGTYGEPISHPGGMAFMNTRQMGIVEGDSIPKRFIPKLVDLHMAGKLPYDQLIETFRFEDINQALDVCAEKTAIKPVLVFD